MNPFINQFAGLTFENKNVSKLVSEFSKLEIDDDSVSTLITQFSGLDIDEKISDIADQFSNLKIASDDKLTKGKVTTNGIVLTSKKGVVFYINFAGCHTEFLQECPNHHPRWVY